MNYERLAELLEQHHTTFNDSAASMLRRQHEAIVKMREAMKRQLWYTGQLEAIVYDEGEQAETHEIVAQSEQALADTEEI